MDPICGSDFLRIVDQYKHLGSMLDANMCHNPDVEIRVRRAMVAYAPIAFKVFGAKEICRRVRLRLFFALVVSRLTYNVHVWGVMSVQHYKRLNACYMRGLRMIASKCRYSRASAMKASDHDVRVELGATSLQCLLIRRRLLLLGQVIQFGNSQLHALLSTSKRDGSKIPWVQAIISDLRILFESRRSKLLDLGPPDANAHRWWCFIRDYSAEWKQLVKSLHITTMEFDVAGTSQSVLHSKTGDFACKMCDCQFTSSKALQAHERSKHSRFSNVSKYVGKSLRCCVCGQTFSTRPRLIAHLSDRRSRGRKVFTCNAVLTTGLVSPVCEHEFAEACLADKGLRKEARKRGLTQPCTVFHAKRIKIGATIASSALLATEDVPSNMLIWCNVHPKKRLRTKTSLDGVVAQWI